MTVLVFDNTEERRLYVTRYDGLNAYVKWIGLPEESVPKLRMLVENENPNLIDWVSTSVLVGITTSRIDEVQELLKGIATWCNLEIGSIINDEQLRFVEPIHRSDVLESSDAFNEANEKCYEASNLFEKAKWLSKSGNSLIELFITMTKVKEAQRVYKNKPTTEFEHKILLESKPQKGTLIKFIKEALREL